MSNNHQLPLSVQPIISYPREAQVGKTYLMTIDLQTSAVDWPYEEEEYPIYCMLESWPLFSSKPVGEPAVVLHRFGGSYGAAQFLLTAAEKESEGEIRITLVNGWGVPVRGLNLTGIKVKQEVKLNLPYEQWGVPVRGLNLTEIEDNQQVKLKPLLSEPQTEQERLIAMITQRIQQAFNLEEILKVTVSEVRDFLKIDRLLIFRLNLDNSGVVAIESINKNCMSILGTTIQDPDFAQIYVEQYEQRIQGIEVIEDIQKANLNQSQINLLSQFQVKATLGVPLATTSSGVSSYQAKQLWGLLIAHQCNDKRMWQLWEFAFLNQVATQLSIAIQQAEIYRMQEASYKQLLTLISSDPLTQLANRRRFEEYLNELWQLLASTKAPMSLILCDLDYFKLYNDTYGHLAGDYCLQQIAKALTLVVKRPEDLVARYGGEEFVVLLPNVEVKEAAQVAEAIRSEVEALKIPHSNSRISEYITISSGVSSIVPNSESSPEELIWSADQALYQAKAQGRDRVVVAG